MKQIAVLAAAALLLTGCGAAPSADGQSSSPQVKTADVPSSDTETAQTTAYDPFAEDDSDSDGLMIRSWGSGADWKDGRMYVLDYAPTVSLRCYEELDGAVNDVGLLLFVNGFSQPYRTDEEPFVQTMHIAEVPPGERKYITVEFEPVAGELGDTLSVEIITMLHPRFMPTPQTKESELFISHSLHPFMPSKLSVTEKTGVTEPAVCTDYTAEPVTEALRKQYLVMGSTGSYSGENRLDSTVFLEVTQNAGIVTPAGMLGGAARELSFSADAPVTLCMLGGQRCTYRVSLFADHELVHGAFDGCDYLDMTPAPDTLCKKEIDLGTLGLPAEGQHHIYFAAVPFYTGKNAGEEVIKSVSAALLPGSSRP